MSLVLSGSSASSPRASSAFDGCRAGYGETPLDPEEADALTPQAREIFGDEPKKIDLYEAEQAINDEVSIALLDDIADGRLVLADILTDAFLRDLHQKLYGDLWTWAGRYRTRDLNIGVEPQHIATEPVIFSNNGASGVPSAARRARLFLMTVI